MVNIAVCDDNKCFASQINEYLKQYAHEKNCQFWIQIFYSGNSLLKDFRNQFDIIFLDIKMQGSNGIEVAKKIRSLNSKLIIVFITSLAEYMSMGYAVEASNYLVKPIKYVDFSVELTKLLKKCISFDEEFIYVKNDNGLYKLYYIKLNI